MKFNPIRNMNYRTRQVVRNVAICFAALFGLLALYYCLIPALADTAGDSQLYVFFDNGLSQYKDSDNTVRINAAVYSDENGQFKSGDLEMKLLADVIANDSTLWNSVKNQLGNVTEENGTVTIENVNPNNVYVSTTTVAHGSYVIFDAWSDGIVYDTVVNYRVNSASREWGYDYYDFQWTSEPTKLEVGKTCYYAPPQLMINRYAAVAATESGGAKSLVQMIYEHGDYREDLNKSSKPEGDSWVNPQDASGRTFYDAQFEMEGKFGDVNGVNDLGKASQSSTSTLEGSVVLGGDGDNGLGLNTTGANKVYHATATFFDYFSDWELAGNPLADHEIAYTYNNADGNDTKPIWYMDHDISGLATIAADFGSDNTTDFDGFEKIGTDGDVSVRTNDGHGYSDDGTYFLQMFNRATVGYSLPSDATGDYYSASLWVRNATNSKQTITMSLYYKLDGVEHTIALNQLSVIGWNADGGKWTKLESGAFYLPSGATDASFRFYSVNTFRLDDFTLEYESANPVTVTDYFDVAKLGFPSGDLGGFELIDNTAFSNDKLETADKDHGTYSGADSMYAYYAATASYPITSGTGNYKFSIFVSPSSWGLSYVTVSLHYTFNGTATEEQVLMYTLPNVTDGGGNEQNKDTDTWHEVAGSFAVPEGAADVSLRFRPYNINAYEAYVKDTHGTATYHLDDFNLKHEETKTVTGTAEVTSDYNRSDSYAKDYADFVGVTLSSKDDVLNRNGAELYIYASKDGDRVPLQGANTYSNKETYLLEATVYSTSKVRVIATHYKSQTSKDTVVKTETIGEFDAGLIRISENFTPPLGAGSTVITIQSVDGSDVIIDNLDIGLDLIDIEGTFSDGSNSIAYSYMGLSFNEAISRYYKAAGASDSIIPLYFGSNSWMTGNMRYYYHDGRTKQYLFTPAEIAQALEYVGCETSLTRDAYINTHYNDPDPSVLREDGEVPIFADSRKNNYDLISKNADQQVMGNYSNAYKGAYLVPLSREYWRTLFGFEYDSYNDLYQKYADLAGGDDDLLESYLKGYAPNNTSLGFSNSRAAEGFVQYDPQLDILMLDGTELEAPYFNEEFIEGDNEAHVAYGEVYDDVDFAFAYNEDSGYYEFDSTRSYYAVRLTQNGSTGKYYMDYYNYDKLVTHERGEVADGEDVVKFKEDDALKYLGVKKADTRYDYEDNGTSQTIYQFYPFNSPDTNDRFATENLMFGMKLDIPFNMMVNEDQMNESMFKFSGDDDVWVYVDGQPVLDIGGTHTAVGGFIDLKHGYGVVGSTYADYTGVWKNKDDLSAGLTTGQEQGIVAVEKAGFAALAALEEIAIDPILVSSLGKIHEQTIAISYELNGVTYTAYQDYHNPTATGYVRDYRTANFTIPEGATDPRLTITGNVANMPIYVDNFGLHNSGGEEIEFTDFNAAPDYFVATTTSYHNTAVVPEWATVGGYQTITVLLDKMDGFQRGNEYYFDFDVAINALNPENITETDWVTSTITSVDFFDDVYTFTAVDGYTYRYRIRRTGDELVVDVNMPGSIDYTEDGEGMTHDDGATVTFALSQFTMKKDYTDAAITNHELTIYYMERGLNSSNFKLAFNFIPNANREVQKEWSDGEAAHEDDGVLVELYSAQPEEISGNFNLKNTGYSLVRVIGHQALENASNDLFSSGFVAQDKQVDVQFQLKDENINSATTLVLNGIPLTEEAYKQLNDKMGMVITIDGNVVTPDNGNGVVEDYEFFNPKNYTTDGVNTADGFQIAYSTNDIGGNPIVTEAQKRSAIKTKATATEGGSVVKIMFNQQDAVADNFAIDVNNPVDTNSWGIVNTDAYLIEAYAWDVDKNVSIPVGTRKINSSNEPNPTLTDSVSGNSRTLVASDMQFVITHIMRNRTTGNDSNGTAHYQQKVNAMTTAVVPGDGLSMTYTPDPNKSRPFTVWRGDWISAFEDVDYTIDSVYNNDQETADPRTISIPTSVDSRAIMIRAGGKPAISTELTPAGFSYNSSYSATNYTNPQPYGSGNYDWNGDNNPDPGVYLLNSANDWTHLWENLRSEMTDDNNVTYQYRYFIRELAILEKDENGSYKQVTDVDYKTTYYADVVAEGNEIIPETFTLENGSKLTLYSLDTELGKIVVLNEEVTDLTIYKDWRLEEDEEDQKIEISVNIYAEDPAKPDIITLYDTVNLNEDNNWCYTLTDVPVYNNNQTNPGKMTYYAVENDSGQFTATYDGDSATKWIDSLSGTQMTVYELNTEEDGTLSLTVTNQISGFVLDIDKFDESGKNPLEGAEFIVYEWIGEGDPPENPTIEDIMNNPDQWQVIEADNAGDETTPNATE